MTQAFSSVRPLLAVALATFGSWALGCEALAQDTPDVPAPAPVVVAVAGGDDAPAAGQDPEDAKERRLDAARRRWEAMTPEQREQIRKRWERFKSMPREKQHALHERLERLGGEESARALAGHLEHMRESSPDHLVRMRRRSAMMHRIESRIVEGLSSELRTRLDGLEASRREAVMRRVVGASVRDAMRGMAEEHSSAEERAMLHNGDGDREAQHRAWKAVSQRVRSAVLEPHAEALAALEGDARQEREAELYEEALWKSMVPGLEEAHRRLAKFLEDPERAVSDGRRRNADEFWKRRFGMASVDLGIEWAPEALRRAFMALPGNRRERVASRLGAKLRRIAKLPADRREAAFTELLRNLSRSDGAEGTAPPRRRDR